MATLQADDIADLVAMTQKDLGRLKWTDIEPSLQEYIAMPNILKKEKVGFQSGYGIQWNVKTATAGAAKNVGMYEVDDVNVADMMQTATIPWRHQTVDYAIERREIAMNRDPARIVDLVKLRRVDALTDLAELMESNFWAQIPTASDSLVPAGVAYWITKNITGTSLTGGGFNGADTITADSDTIDPGGLDSASSYTNWRNWTCKYTTVSKTDLIRKWRKAATFTNFKAPVAFPDYAGQSRYGYYTNYDVIGPLEEALEAQNENLGNDVASKDGQVVFRKVPVMWAPYLEDDGDDPVYGIDWSVFSPVFLKGEYMREDPAKPAPNQHTVIKTHIDCTMNYKCTNRRRLFVLSKSTWA